jgi:hypothetical protein
LKTAFNLSTTKIDNIDFVYPKEQLKDEKDLLKRTENFLKTKVRDRKIDADDEHLIESLFENANKAMQIKEKEKEKEELEGDSDDDESEGEGELEDVDEEKYFRIGSGFNNFNQTYKNKESTIVDIMCDKKFEREGKINELIRSLRNNFPPLEGDKVTFIGSTFMNYGNSDPYLNHCIVLNSCDQMPVAN